MFNKYKIKKRKKFVNPLYIFIIFAISLLFVSYGYAWFYDTHTIEGKVTFKTSSSDSNLEYGNSTYYWEQTSHWLSDDGTYDIYAMELCITNLDEDFFSDKKIEISFDVPDGCVLNSSTSVNIWQAESMALEGNTISMTFAIHGSWLPMGETLKIYPHLYFENPTDVTITNLKFAGKYAIYTPQTN